jgi:hypothetical protein
VLSAIIDRPLWNVGAVYAERAILYASFNEGLNGAAAEPRACHKSALVSVEPATSDGLRPVCAEARACDFQVGRILRSAIITRSNQTPAVQAKSSVRFSPAAGAATRFHGVEANAGTPAITTLSQAFFHHLAAAR